MAINYLHMKILKVFEKKLRNNNYSVNTINNYVSCINMFLGLKNIKDPYNVTTRGIIDFLESYEYSSVSQQNQYISSLKLFAKYILNKKDIHLNKIRRPRSERRLPRVIDGCFIKHQLSKIENLKHRAILTLTYSVELRVSEVVNLKIKDIDSNRMIIHIKNAKGRKDRVVPLSESVLQLLRLYWRSYKPKEYLFNGQK